MGGTTWEVVGGKDKGGIMVRPGKEAASGKLDEKLATGATVEQLELVGDRLHYRKVSGAGPDTGWVTTKIGEKDLVVPLTSGADAGEADKGRERRAALRAFVEEAAAAEAAEAARIRAELSAPRHDKSYPVAIFERLQTVVGERKAEIQAAVGGAATLLQIVVLDGEAGGGTEARFRVEITGEDVLLSRGPVEGANLTVSMKDSSYLQMWKNHLSAMNALTTQQMFLEGDTDLAGRLLPPLLVKEKADGDPPEWDGLKAPPARGKFVPDGTGRAKLDTWRPALAKVAGKLRTTTPYKEYLEAKPKKDFFSEMDKIRDDGPIGHYYGLQFPYTLEMIHRYGKEWLTKAMHAAGTLGKDNSVTKMVVEPFIGGSMSMKCFLHCEYAKEEAGLHPKLFCKYPFPCATEADRKVRYISRFLLNNDGPELDFARIISAGAPMRCVKYYYGDICLKTATVLLITEKLELPPHSADFGPYELEPIPYKSVDYLLDDPFPYYDAMSRNVAQLAAWGVNGKLGRDILDVFRPPEHPSAFFMGSKKRAGEFIHFVRENAPQLFPDGICDEWFEQTLLEVIPEIEQAQKDILNFLFADPAYCGFTHQNMNTDNAIFWRDETGNVESGFIDWGRFKRDNLARGLTTGYMCTDMCAFLQKHDEQLCRNFVDEYVGAGGPNISFGTFWEHYLLSWCILGLLLVDSPHQIWISSIYTQPDGWKTIKDYRDPRVFTMPNYSNGTLAMLRNFAWYWKYKDLPAFWRKWRQAHPPSAVPKPKK